MNNLKKKNNVILRSIVLLLLGILAASCLFVGCSGGNEESSTADSSAQSADESSAVGSSTDSSSESDSTSEAVSDVSSEISSESSDASTESSDVESDAEDSSSADDESSVPDESVEPEILGSGTKADPYLIIPDESRTVTTVAIPAGETVYYSIYRVGGTVLTVESENISIEYNGIPYIAKKGKLTLAVADALASEATLFEICNEGETEEAFVLKFANPVGTLANPVSLDTLEGDHSISLKKDNATGYFYTFTVTADGTVRFYIESETASSMTVNRIRDTIPSQFNSDEEPKVDDEGKSYFEIEVAAGDELVINVCAKPEGGKYPAADVTWSAVVS